MTLSQQNYKIILYGHGVKTFCHHFIDNAMDKELRALGLSEQEISVYISLYKYGHLSIRSLASKCGINRGTTYEALKSLQKKGLVSYAPVGKRKSYIAQDPHILLDIAKQKEKYIAHARKKIQFEILPKIRASRTKTIAPQVQYYEGDEGIGHILRDVLSTVEKSNEMKYYVYSSKPLRKYIYRFFPNFTKARIEKNIHVRVIAIGEGGEKTAYSKRKWLNTTRNFTSTSYIIIYPPKYSIISLSSDNYPYGVTVEEASIAKTQELLFISLWKKL